MSAPVTPPELRHWLRQAVATWPQRLALRSASGSLSYAELGARVMAQAADYTAAGLQPGDRLGIAASRHPDTLVAILAALEAGLSYVPFDLGYPDDRLQMMLEDSQPRAVVGEPAAVQALSDRLGALPALLQPAAASHPHASAPGAGYVLFTSGSTGRPKGVAMGERPLRHLIQWHAGHRRLGQAATTLLFAPLSFDVHFQELLSTVACGGTLLLVDEATRRDPQQLTAALREHAVERIFLPYVALQLLADALSDGPLPPLRDVISAGEQLQISATIRGLFERLPEAVLHNHYGPTETHVVTAFELAGDRAAWPTLPPIGRALPHVQLALRPLPGGEGDADEGELLLGGDTLAEGYLGRADLSAERFRSDLDALPGRAYLTGDRVRRDADGVFSYLGRCDRQLKIDGFRIEPGEIEVALLAHTGLKDAAVGAVDLPGLGQQLVAWLVAGQTDRAALESELRRQLRGTLPAYMQPQRWVFLDVFPLTPSGKLDRAALRLPERDSAEAPTASTPAELITTTWCQLLGVNQLDPQQNLFEAGARSLLVLRFLATLRSRGITGLSVADVYDRPTLAGLCATLERGPGAAATRPRNKTRDPLTDQGIAIIGLAARCAGAADVEAFWDNLIAGREGIRQFRPEDIDADVPAAIRSHPAFVAARGVLDDADRFDAGFFGLSAREATLIDPQQRILLELAWTALEHAGVDPAAERSIGVFAGSANNTYLPALRQHAPELVQQSGEFAAMLASEKDYVATRIAHRLDLHGPAVSVHTACSTGLVAVAQACLALRSGQCALALAGGASVIVPQAGGYVHVEGGMESADGHCRPFDAEASGTVFASAAGMVLLKRLDQALADGDTVYAVIRGVGLNNDGGGKASFTAPSKAGQAEAVRRALDDAGVSARGVGYVEAHGTGTALGDPIEVSALVAAFADDSSDVGYCGLGSLKSNLGHTIAAAGVLGLIKAALCLQREQIPATLHYRRPNPQLALEQTPFRIIDRCVDWPRGETPRYAGVSSFGVGGTNAHLLLEEAPAARGVEPAPDNSLQLLPLSARSSAALQQRALDLAHALQTRPELSLAACAATLTRGRHAMNQRAAVAARSRDEAIAALQSVSPTLAAASTPRLVFLLPGQGAQSAGMAAGLYDELAAFRSALDDALAAVRLHLDIDLRPLLLQADEPYQALLQQTRYAQPALFCVEVALARWAESLGLRPAAIIGHSIGELAGAHLAGVMSLDDVAQLVCSRAAAMWAQPRGAMLAVRAGADRLRPLLPETLEVAALNAPELTVVAGPQQAIDEFAAQLGALSIGSSALKVSHAFHSASMDGALADISAAAARCTTSPPAISLYSCVDGERLGARAIDPGYWAQQVRSSVQFTRAVATEMAKPDTLFVEVGPGQALSALLRQHRDAAGAAPRCIALQGPAGRPGDALAAVKAIGQLWTQGCTLQWPQPRGGARATLPTYPFADTRFWFPRRAAARALEHPASSALAVASSPLPETAVADRRPAIQAELTRLLSDVCGLPASELQPAVALVELGLDSLSLTQASLELDRVFGVKLRFRRLMEDLDSIDKLVVFLDAQLPAERFAPAPAPVTLAPTSPATTAVAGATTFAAPAAGLAMHASGAGSDLLSQVIQQQMQLMQQQLSLLAGVTPAPAPTLTALPLPPPAAAAMPATTALSASEAAVDLRDKPFGASARITLKTDQTLSAEQRRWLDDFTRRYLGKLGKSRSFSQQHRALMADPRVVTGFNPQWKDLVFPIVAERSQGARIWDLDGNEYIDLLSCFGANLLGYQPPAVIAAMHAQLDRGIEVGPQHPLAARVSQLISEFTGHPRVAFCNTGSEAVMGAMRVARTVTGRKTIAIFTNSYHGIFDEVIVRGTRQLRSLSAAPGILASAVENVLVLDYASEESLKVLRERGHELAAIMIEPVQNKYPTLQPREFVHSLREICDRHGCALIFDEVVTGFRLAPGGAQQFYGVRADLCTYGKIIGGGLPLAAIGGAPQWLDALDGGGWQYGDDSYPEAGVTYFAGTFVRHPLALAAAEATLEHVRAGGQGYYDRLNARTQGLIDRLNSEFSARSAPVKAVHCASLWRLQWDEDQRYVSLFYYLARFHGLHLFEQFGHFVTEAMGETEIERIVSVFLAALDELMALGFIRRRDGLPPPGGGKGRASEGELAPGQAERWMAASFDGAALRALNETFHLTLQGEVDEPALLQAIDDLRQRHLAFRLCFDSEAPRQRLIDLTLEPSACIDLRGEADPAATLARLTEARGQRSFALDQAPLIDLALLHCGEREWLLHGVASHLVFDGWAASVFLAELAEAYRSRCAGRAPQLPAAESPIEFAAGEAERMRGAAGQEALAFWRGAMANPPPPLSLGDLSPPARRSFAADTRHLRYDGALFAGLQRIARERRVTLFQLLLASVATLLRRLTAQDDFVVSLPYASQALGRHPALLADGVLDLPIRLRCAADASPLDLLPQVRERLLDALDQPLITQGLLARELKLPSLGNRPPLSGVFFNLNPKVDLSGFAPLQARMQEGRKPGLLSEILFNFYEDSDALSLDLHVSTEFFSASRIDTVIEALGDELKRLVTPESAQSRRPTPPATIAPVSATPSLGAAIHDVRSLLQAQIRATPEREALCSAGRTLSYAQFGARAEAIAETLVEAGVGAGDRVGISLRRGTDLVAALAAVWEAGATYVPLDPAFPRGRLQHMADDSGLRVVLSDQPAAVPVEVAQGRRVLDIGAIATQPRAPWTSRPLSADSAAYILYTSGSTGKPKGVEVRQRNVASFLLAMQQAPGIAQDDRLLAVTTPSFDISVLELFLPLTVGACVVVASDDEAKNPGLFWPLLKRERISLLQTTPSVLQMWLSDGAIEDLAPLRLLLGGEGLPTALAVRLLPQVRALWNMYGPTETTIWSSCWRVDAPERGIVVGEAIAGTAFYLLDAQQRPVSAGQPGEIAIGGEGVAAGYVGQPALTAERFITLPGVTGPVYRTGDLGQLDEQGRLRHLGRIDSQVKLRGYRIELGEIEATLSEQPGIRQSVVCVREDRPGDVRLVAYVVTDGREVDEAALREQLRQGLPDYMLPQHTVRLDALPLLPNGKTDRAALPAPALPAKQDFGRAPSDATEAAVVAAVADLLGVDSVGVEQSFFQLGGHSLAAIQLSTRLNKALGCSIRMRDVFELSTAAAIAGLIREQLRGDAAVSEEPQIPRLDNQSLAPQSVMQRRLFELSGLNPSANTYNMPSGHRLQGPLDVARLERALQAMIVRQPILRTVLLRDGEQLLQRVVDRVDFSLPAVIDLRHLPKSEREAEARRRVDALVELPLAMDQAPMMACALYRLGENDHVLFLMPHHAIWDGWSFDVFYNEIAVLYPQPEAVSSLTPLPLSYADFSAWHNAFLQGPAYQAQLQFWRDTLRQSGPFRTLRTDYPRSAMMSGESHSLVVDLPIALIQRLHQRAREMDATLYLLLLAAYAATLHRFSGESELLIGNPVRGRNQPELEGLLGYFVNLVAIPLRVAPEHSLGELVADVKQRCIGALSNADVVLEDLMGLLKVESDGPGKPLYQASFSFQDVRQRPVHWGDLAHSRFKTAAPGVSEDLALFFVETNDDLHAILSYNSALFRESTIASFHESLLECLQRLADSIDSRVSDLPTHERSIAATTPLATTSMPSRSAAAEPRALASGGQAEVALAVAYENQLREIWSSLLERDGFDSDSSFFDLGGHSLMAVRMFHLAQQATGVNLPLATLIHAPSLRQLAREFAGAAVRKAGDGSAFGVLVPIQPNGRRRPMFFIHAVGGNVLNYLPLARALGPDQPCFGLQSLGLDGKTQPLSSITEMARIYVEAIRQVQPRGPYRLGGGSMGGCIALEIAQQLHAQGEAVELLALFDTFAPSLGARVRALRTGSRRGATPWQRILRWLRAIPSGQGWSTVSTRYQNAGRSARVYWHRLTSRELPHDLRYFVIERLNFEALYAYTAAPYAGRITLFRVEDHGVGQVDRQLGWGDIAEQGVEVVSMSGVHEWFVEEPALGRHLARLLDTLDDPTLANSIDDICRATA